MARSASEPERFRHERGLAANGLVRIAGVDEAGRGPLAGPVAAAAVILPLEWILNGMPTPLGGLNDSKQLSAGQREVFYAALAARPEAVWALELVDAETIDRLNILQATHRAMNLALARLTAAPQHVLVDGLRVKSMVFPQTALVGGDALSYSIAAASVIAKVARDRLMLEYDARYPEYGFAENKGYGTPKHLAALRRHGPSPIHRRSFAPIRAAQAVLSF
jgi:ribonuclease HII